ncbi:two-component sensor histidine kinase BarA [Kangiella sediminilitoris]|uniref:histidine kinase n=1 Tax=Kangiella sediminilitoris TaxID=1144748 RepID=A0A1B3BBT8_9GAMM|nr:two-component sensor histidine kinase BarA [Kangiella sediminilitoris]AOE50251.1 Hpt sensor hybrid histidine kinase [Kangiella sediminilitoris]
MRNWGISRRILTLALTPTLLVCLLLGSFFINNHIQDSEDSLISRGKTIATHLALASEYGIITLDNKTLQEMAQAARDNDKELLAVAIFDQNNRVLTSVGAAEYLSQLHMDSPQDLAQIGVQSNLMRFARMEENTNGMLFHAPILSKFPEDHESWRTNVKSNTEILGYVSVLMSQDFSMLSRYSTIITTIIISLIGLMIGGFLARRMSASVTDPIVSMAKGVDKIKDGKLDTRISSDASAELKTLQDGINLMAESMEHNQEEMQQAVDQATEDLRETLETLEVNNLELDIARRQAIEASRIKTEFLANMSHEIRTPMNGVIGFTDLLLKTELNNKQKDFLFDIKRSASGLLSIIDDILDYSKIEAGKMSFERYPFDLRECVDDVFKILGPNASEKGIELVSLIYSDVPKALLGDPIRIKQIITNLLNNAVKFTKSGSVELYAEVESEGKKGLKLKIQVKDSGIGLTEEQQNNLFKAFSQADSTTTREFGGTGLGLVISKSLVEKMGGNIGVESSEGEGSTFWFTLQCERAESLPEDGLTGEFLASKSVLIFDPHPATRLSLTQMLEDWQMQVRSFEKIDDLMTEVDLYAQSGKNVDLIIIGGQRFRRRIQRIEYICNKVNSQLGCPVITFSTSSDVDFLERLSALGVARAMEKPITYRALYNSLIELLRSNKTTRPKAKDAPVTHSKANELKGSYVLAVDDNPANLRLVSTLLEDLNIKVDTADSGMQAVALSKDKVYDAILMDIQMPEMNGLEATRTIRANATNQSTPVIALTAHAMVNEREKLLDSGMDDYMTKPVSEQDLINVLLKWTQSDSTLTTTQEQAELASEDTEETLDWDLSLKLANDKEDLARDMLKMMVESNHETGRVIHACYQAQNFDELLQHIHKLHGASCYVGTPRLKRLSNQYESKLKKQQYNLLEDLHQELIEELKAINEAAQPYLEGVSSSAETD